MNIDKTLKVHTLINYFSKFFNIAINFYMVRITIGYLGDEKNGLWATLLSIVSMMAIGDLGIGNGLKNRITEALARDDERQVKSYISTAYITIGIISVFVCIVTLLISKFFVKTGFGYSDFKGALYIIIIGFSFNLISGIINSVLYAYQKSNLVSFGQVLNSLILLLGVFEISKLGKGNLIHISLVYVVALILSNVILSGVFFLKHKSMFPSISAFRKDTIGSILNLGMKFFFLQLCGLVLFSTDSLIIANLIGLTEVTQYDILNKVYNNLTIMYSIILIPIWSAVTYAYAKKDVKWIKKILFKLKLLLVPFSLGVIGVSIFFKPITILWLGDDKGIPVSLVILFALYTIVQGWTAIYCSIVNGMGKIEVQLYTAIIGAIINIPLSIYLGKTYGIFGVKVATFVCQVIPAIVLPIQVRYELKRSEVNESVAHND